MSNFYEETKSKELVNKLNMISNNNYNNDDYIFTNEQNNNKKEEKEQNNKNEFKNKEINNLYQLKGQKEKEDSIIIFIFIWFVLLLL